MNLTLTRKRFDSTGIYGELTGDNFSLKTLEHSYPTNEGEYIPKLPAGDYTCKRGPHRLHNMTEDFETFEITGVEGHQGILFHKGNYNKDSEGCVLLGTDTALTMILHSTVAFSQFIEYTKGLDSFTLHVCDMPTKGT